MLQSLYPQKRCKFYWFWYKNSYFWWKIPIDVDYYHGNPKFMMSLEKTNDLRKSNQELNHILEIVWMTTSSLSVLSYNFHPSYQMEHFVMVFSVYWKYSSTSQFSACRRCSIPRLTWRTSNLLNATWYCRALVWRELSVCPLNGTTIASSFVVLACAWCSVFLWRADGCTAVVCGVVRSCV
jgi:hypothetical protein